LQASLHALTAQLDRSVLRDLQATQTANRRSGFEQPERQEEGDKHKTKPEIGASEVRSCYLTFASIEEQNLTGNKPLLQPAAHCGPVTAAVVLFLAVCSFGSCGITWRHWTCGMRQSNHVNGNV
jgi:hypothetical protein